MIQFKHIKYFGDDYQVFIDDRKRTVEARYSFEKRTVSGIAKCHPADQFNPDRGVKIALNRCAIKANSLLLEQTKKWMLAVQQVGREIDCKLLELRSEASYIYKNVLN